MADLLRSALSLSLAYWITLCALVIASAGLVLLFLVRWGQDLDEGRR